MAAASCGRPRATAPGTRMTGRRGGGMDFEFSEKEEAFRKDVRAWLEANVPDDLRGKAFASSRADVDEVRRLRAWQKTMWEAGYVGMSWPKEFGGRGAPLTEQIILFQEMARAESPQFVNRGGLSMLGPTLMKYGTPAQQTRHLQKILTADELWCQGFSEPNAGSEDRKSTRPNSSHRTISYAVFCLKKKKQNIRTAHLRPNTQHHSADRPFEYLQPGILLHPLLCHFDSVLPLHRAPYSIPTNRHYTHL